MDVTPLPNSRHLAITSVRTKGSISGRMPSWMMTISSGLQMPSRWKTPLRMDSCADAPPGTIHRTLLMPYCLTRRCISSCQLSRQTISMASISAWCSKLSSVCMTTGFPSTGMNCFGISYPILTPEPPAMMMAMVMRPCSFIPGTETPAAEVAGVTENSEKD